ncbi:hypothetical protein [Neobacillus vireti]
MVEKNNWDSARACDHRDCRLQQGTHSRTTILRLHSFMEPAKIFKNV